MSQATNESDNKVMPKDQVSSPSIDESSSGGSMAGGSGGGMVLKKGPWTSAEDAILIDYVKKHGEGNWNAVQKHSGLSRCGKSCRLRWANHLRPNLKKGAFTLEEEQLILELHARMGNKWARMAAHLPGRTDNEIKNYWNTRIKRLQRAGLPLYPPGMSIRASNENEQGQGGLDFSSADKQHTELLQGSNYEIPEFKIHDFGANQGVLPYAPPMPDIPLSSMLSQGLISQNYGFMNPTVNHTKLLRDPETLFPSFHDSITSGLPTFGQFWDEPSEKIHRTFGLGYQDDPDPGSKSPIPFGGAIHGSHASLNGNYSASGPLLGIAKLELPSLQYPETDLCSWPACPSTPPPEPADSYIQSPLATESLQSGCVSPRNSGMLEAVLHQAQTHSIARKQPCEKSLISSVVMPSEMVGSSTLNVCEPDWEEYSDPISPLGRSAASVFNECTPPTSGSSMGELSPPKASSGSEAMVATGESASTRSAGERITPPRQEFLRPDALLGSDWLEESSQIAREHCMLNDAIATLLGEDLCSEYKNAACEMSSTLTQGKELESYPWDNMPGVFHVSEQP